MSRTKAFTGFVVVLFLVAIQLSAVAGPPAGSEAALKASDITGKLLPDQVFFRG
jgi:hypothetical protein